LAVTTNGINASDFNVGSLGATTLAPGASTSFTVTFTPAAPGSRTAAIHISSSDDDENPFDIALTGTGQAEIVERWVQRYDGPGHGSDSPAGVAVDAAGNVAVTGS